VPRIRLNQKTVDSMKAPTPSGRDTLYWDADLKGFGVRCSGRTNARVYVVQRDIDGRTVRVNIAAVNEVGFAQAKRLAADALLGLRQGVNPKRRTAVPTLAEALDRYLEARSNLRPGSVRMYRQIERTLADWLDWPLTRVTGEMVEARHRELAARHGKVSANFAMKTLGILWGYVADRVPGLGPNPVRRLRRQWFAEPRRTRMVPIGALPAFHRAVMALPNPAWRDLIRLLLFTGMRRTEATTLRWADVDFVDRTIHLPAERTKAGRRLDLPMSTYVHDLLRGRWLLGDGGDHVFESRGGPITASARPFDAIAAASGVRVSPHDLRRTYASVANSAGVSVFSIKLMLNHSTTDTTAGYVIVSPAELRAAVQKVCDRMKALCGIV
jgi:integrase